MRSACWRVLRRVVRRCLKSTRSCCRKRFLLACGICFLQVFILYHFHVDQYLSISPFKRSAAIVPVIYARINSSKSSITAVQNSDEDIRERAAVTIPSTTTDVVDAPPPPASGLSSSLPGVSNHRILTLSDDAFQSTPVDQQMGWYGQADGGGSCSDDFGNNLIDRWRSTNLSYCDKSSDSDMASTIDCHLLHQTRHHGNGDQLCHMRNVAVDLSLFNDDARTSAVIKDYVDSRHFRQPYIRFPVGFIRGDCHPVARMWRAEYMPGWNADLTVGPYDHVLKASLFADRRDGGGGGDRVEGGSRERTTMRGRRDGGEPVQVRRELCEQWVDHPVLVQQRDTFANFFHDSEDFVNVFLAMAVLRWLPGQMQVYLTDLYPKGPFWDIWGKVFSQRRGRAGTADSDSIAQTAWDLKLRYGNVTSGRYVCFKDLAIGIYGPAAPITLNSRDTPCSKTALVRSYSDYVIRGLGLHHETHYASNVPSRTVVITYMSRRMSKEWPERKYCDSKHSFFLCHLWDGFGPRHLGRMISNDREVVQALKQLEQYPVSAEFKHVDRIIVQDVDFNELAFEEQIRIDLRTDIMIGPHGAGLMHTIFMRDRAKLIELFVDGSSANRHFHNLAHWYGRSYSGISASNPIRIEQLLLIVRTAINEIDTTKY